LDEERSARTSNSDGGLPELHVRRNIDSIARSAAGADSEARRSSMLALERTTKVSRRPQGSETLHRRIAVRQ
jgi:hypothetical protein